MPLNSIKSSRILLSPLNWGLGHVSRTIPVIQELLKQNNEVIICCDENQRQFYKDYFPKTQYITHNGYPFKFNGKGNWTLDILKELPALKRYVLEEKEIVNKFVKTFKPDLIISDQRFGFVSQEVKSVIISHQLSIPVARWNIALKRWNIRLLKVFDEIWIPDTSDQKYSGKLSNGKLKNKYFIGILSRFSESINEKMIQKEPQYKYLGIVSGPPPYNKQLFYNLLKKLSKTGQKCMIIAPKEICNSPYKKDNVTIFPSPTHTLFLELILNSEIIISRSGYSTLMDLAATQSKAILIPTPGQKEQIYLGKLHENNSDWTFKSKSEFLEMIL